MNDYYFSLAQQAAERANSYGNGDNNIKAEYVYSQWCHETGGFDSALANQYHNLGGVTQTEPNDTPQPDGTCYYMQFDSPESYAHYFGGYLRYYRENGIYDAQNIGDYVRALKAGGYFGDDLDAYLADCERILNENFSGMA